MRHAAMISHQRSGTYFVAGCIGAHPLVYHTGEIFNRNLPRSRALMWEQINSVSDNKPGAEIMFLNIKYNQITNDVFWLLTRRDVPVIQLIRRNLLRLYFSGELHSWRGIHPHSTEIPVFRFDSYRFGELVTEVERHQHRFKHLADLTLYYEDLTGNRQIRQLPDWAVEQVCGLLQVDPNVTMDTHFNKKAPENFLDHLEGVPANVLRRWND